MSKTAIISIANQWFDAFNVQNLENLLALYHNEAEHYSPKLKALRPETKGLITGKAALRAWWKDAFDRLPTLEYLPQNIIAGDTSVFMEYIRYVEGEENMIIGEVLEIKDGLIISSRVYHG